jgi:hypothetical protein
VPRRRIFDTSFASVYPLDVTKAERKNRTRDEVDEVISWLTGYDDAGLRGAISDEVDLETFFDDAPRMNPNAALITGLVCGVRVEDIEDPLMQRIRWMDKLVDELARGKRMGSILRGGEEPVRGAAQRGPSGGVRRPRHPHGAPQWAHEPTPDRRRGLHAAAQPPRLGARG